MRGIRHSIADVNLLIVSVQIVEPVVAVRGRAAVNRCPEAVGVRVHRAGADAATGIGRGGGAVGAVEGDVCRAAAAGVVIIKLRVIAAKVAICADVERNQIAAPVLYQIRRRPAIPAGVQALAGDAHQGIRKVGVIILIAERAPVCLDLIIVISVLIVPANRLIHRPVFRGGLKASSARHIRREHGAGLVNDQHDVQRNVRLQLLGHCHAGGIGRHGEVVALAILSQVFVRDHAVGGQFAGIQDFLVRVHFVVYSLCCLQRRNHSTLHTVKLRFKIVLNIRRYKCIHIVHRCALSVQKRQQVSCCSFDILFPAVIAKL